MESLGILRVDSELSVLMQLPVKLEVFVEIQEEKKKVPLVFHPHMFTVQRTAAAFAVLDLGTEPPSQ